MTSLFSSFIPPWQIHAGPVHDGTVSVRSCVGLLAMSRRPCFLVLSICSDSYSLTALSFSELPDP